MIESGSMRVSFSPLFQNRRCKGEDLILILGSINGSRMAQSNYPIVDAVSDAKFKLDELVASRSPVEAEIAFLTQWLEIADVPEVAPESPPVPESLSETPSETPIQDDSEVRQDDMEISFRLAGLGEDSETFTRK